MGPIVFVLTFSLEIGERRESFASESILNLTVLIMS